MKGSSIMENFFQRNRYSFLLACLLFIIAIMPTIVEFFDLRIIVSIAFSLVTISAIYTVTHKRNVYIIGIILTILVIASIWWYYIAENIYAKLAYNISNTVFLLFIIYHIFTTSIKSKIVTREILYSAIVVYLLIGFIWSHVYILIECLHPGSFYHSEGIFVPGYQTFIYFSFVTLTTLGFGDITPITPEARSLVILEAITGQFYLIINVSWLVGLYVAHTRDQRKNF